MVTPLTQRYFSFGELGNSLMYSLCGVEVILGFFFVRWLSRKVADRVVLAVGLVICCTACIWCLIFLCNPRGASLPGTHTNIHTRVQRNTRAQKRMIFCAKSFLHGWCWCVEHSGAILGYTPAELTVLCK